MYIWSFFSVIFFLVRDFILNGKMVKENIKILKSVVIVNVWRKGCYYSIKYNLCGKSSWYVKLTVIKIV